MYMQVAMNIISTIATLALGSRPREKACKGAGQD